MSIIDYLNADGGSIFGFGPAIRYKSGTWLGTGLHRAFHFYQA
jgi:hypothetical protein